MARCRDEEMMTPCLRSRRSTLLTLLLSTLLLATLPAAPAAAATRAELDEKASRAGAVFREMREAPDKRIPANLLARARCVAVIPNVIKAAWVVGGRYGKGLLSCRGKTGEWSPPVIVTMTGGSFGLQAGASSTDVVLCFMSTASVRSLLSNNIQLSGEAGIAAGPVGRGTEAATDGRFTAEIYSYARSRGLFAGVSLSGGYLGVQREDTSTYYGKSYSPIGVLFEHKATSVPKSAWTFLGALPKPKQVAVPPAAAAPAPAPRAAAPAATPRAAAPAHTPPAAAAAAPASPAPAVRAPAPAAPPAAAASAPSSTFSVLRVPAVREEWVPPAPATPPVEGATAPGATAPAAPAK